MIGPVIRSLRSQRRITQGELGKLCGFGDSAQGRIANYEAGSREPKINELNTIANVLGTDVVCLLLMAMGRNEASAVLGRLDEGALSQLESFLESAEKT